MEDVCDAENLQLIWVDAGYSGQGFAQAVHEICNAKVEVIKRNSPEFKILPRRWVVERIFWLVGTLSALEQRL